MTTATLEKSNGVKNRFKLLRGGHTTGSGANRKNYHASDPNNNIVESEIDLEARFGREKFQNLDKLGISQDSALQRQIDALEEENAKLRRQLQDQNADKQPNDEYNLQGMSISELRKYADEMEIELGTATKKDEIINVIQSALDSQ